VRETIVASLKFVALFLVLSGAAYLVFSSSAAPNQLAAESTRVFLQVVGRYASVEEVGGFPGLQVEGFGYPVQVNDLCAGKLELAVLFGIIFATTERSLAKRLWGFLGGAAVAFALNPVRIGLSVVFFSPIVHGVLFRMVLVLVIVSYYAVWFLWSGRGAGRDLGCRERTVRKAGEKKQSGVGRRTAATGARGKKVPRRR